MSLYPTGMISFHAALARTAEVKLPQIWASAKAEEKAFLRDGISKAEILTRGYARGEVARGAYQFVRPLLADGLLPAFLRGHVGPPKLIEPSAWFGSAADHVERVGGAALLGEGERGEVVIRKIDLEAVLGGNPTSPRLTAPAVPKPATASDGRRRGRPPPPDADLFWIEACRRIYHGDSFEPQKDFAIRMVDWAAEQMKKPYDDETVRKKIGLLVAALKRPDKSH